MSRAAPASQTTHHNYIHTSSGAMGIFLSSGNENGDLTAIRQVFLPQTLDATTIKFIQNEIDQGRKIVMPDTLKSQHYFKTHSSQLYPSTNQDILIQYKTMYEISQEPNLTIQYALEIEKHKVSDTQKFLVLATNDQGIAFPLLIQAQNLFRGYERTDARLQDVVDSHAEKVSAVQVAQAVAEQRAEEEQLRKAMAESEAEATRIAAEQKAAAELESAILAESRQMRIDELDKNHKERQIRLTELAAQPTTPPAAQPAAAQPRRKPRQLPPTPPTRTTRPTSSRRVLPKAPERT